MGKIRMVLMLAAIFSTQQVFADDAPRMPVDATGDGPCATVAKACLAAGFSRAETADKKFWQDCMKPVVLGKTVSGVTVDPATVQACRTLKIEEVKNELNELQAVAPASN